MGETVHIPYNDSLVHSPVGCPKCKQCALPRIQWVSRLRRGGPKGPKGPRYPEYLFASCQRCSAELFHMHPADYVEPDDPDDD